MGGYQRMLSARVYDSVTRIADGYVPDAEDRAALTEAAATMRGEVEVNGYIASNGLGPFPTHPCLPNGDWEDVVWKGVQQLGLAASFGGNSIAALTVLADALTQVARGDRTPALRLVPLVRRLAALVEQSTARGCL